MPNHPIIGPMLQTYPQFERDTRHYLSVIGPRIAEAMILALDLPRRPNSRNEEVMTMGITYDPDGPQDIQRFIPAFCGIYSLNSLRADPSEMWRRVLDEHDRYDLKARISEGAFGAALVQLTFLTPEAHHSLLSPARQRTSLMTSFVTVRLSLEHANIPGDSDYALHISRWLYYLRVTGDLTPST